MTTYILARDRVKYHLVGVYSSYIHLYMSVIAFLLSRLSDHVKLVVIRASCPVLPSQL